MPSIEVKNISKKFEDSIAIQDISFKLEEGKLLTLLGPSGSGKTTILRLIAGLIELDTGEIYFDSIDVAKVPTEERNIGFVFQSYALFPHLPVSENIAFGLETRKWAKEDIIIKVKEMLALVGLTGKGRRYPRELSGGEKSRVALARALAPNPSLLLLDEPLSALDMSLKESLRKTIRDIQQKIGVSTIYVTHDQAEAMEISDQILVLNHGQIVESGSPQELYLTPRKKFTAEFFGVTNILTGKVITKYERFYLDHPLGCILLPKNCPSKIDEKITIAIFPQHIILSNKTQKLDNEFPAIVVSSSFGGSIVSVTVEVKGFPIEIHFTSSRTKSKFTEGEKIYLSIPESSILFLE